MNRASNLWYSMSKVRCHVNNRFDDVLKLEDHVLYSNMIFYDVYENSENISFRFCNSVAICFRVYLCGTANYSINVLVVSHFRFEWIYQILWFVRMTQYSIIVKQFFYIEKLCNH